MTEFVKTLNDLLRTKGLKLATAESCTGGMIASSITDLAGSSDVFDRGFVTYSNQSKTDMLGVDPSTIDTFGAVSGETAEEMVAGALANSLANIAIAVTGIAGPSGGTPDKPVGLVYIGIGKRGGMTNIYRHVFSGDRDAVRTQTRDTALNYVFDLIKG